MQREKTLPTCSGQGETGHAELLIDVQQMSKIYNEGRENEVRALDNISLSVQWGEFLCILGQSGSGKSTLMNILGCLDIPTYGTYYLDGQPVSDMKPSVLAGIRNREIGFIFQGFNLIPALTAIENVELPLIYRGIGREERRRLAADALCSVGLEKRMDHRPGEMSGGQQQRVAIARAVAAKPPIIMADEPTGNLDSASGLDIMRKLTALNEEGTSIILITHDLGVVAQMCDEVIVMYAGSICEQGTADEIFYNPCHEYTKGLLRSIPSASNVGEKLEPIHGTPIDLLNMPAGCPFAPRCEAAMKICLRERAERMRINEDHLASCWMNVKKGLEDGSIELAEDKDAERKDGADA